MRTRALTLVALMLLMLAATPQFEAMPTGIGAAGDNGCTCHGGASGDTSVIVEGLPDRFNASETYPSPSPLLTTQWNSTTEAAPKGPIHGTVTQVVSESSLPPEWFRP